MYPKYFIAPDKFLARSHLVAMTSEPSNLVCGSEWDDLSQEIWSKFISNQQTEATYKQKMMLWKHLYIYIKVNGKIVVEHRSDEKKRTVAFDSYSKNFYTKIHDDTFRLRIQSMVCFWSARR